MRDSQDISAAEKYDIIFVKKKAQKLKQIYTPSGLLEEAYCIIMEVMCSLSPNDTFTLCCRTAHSISQIPNPYIHCPPHWSEVNL